MSNFRPSSRKAEEASLKEVLEKMIEVYKWKGKLHQTRIKSLWHEMMGPAISRHTTELKVYRKKLFVQIDSAALRQELAMGREKIRKNINREIGEDYLQEVIIR